MAFREAILEQQAQPEQQEDMLQVEEPLTQPSFISPQPSQIYQPHHHIPSRNIQVRTSQETAAIKKLLSQETFHRYQLRHQCRRVRTAFPWRPNRLRLNPVMKRATRKSLGIKLRRWIRHRLYSAHQSLSINHLLSNSPTRLLQSTRRCQFNHLSPPAQTHHLSSHLLHKFPGTHCNRQAFSHARFATAPTDLQQTYSQLKHRPFL